MGKGARSGAGRRDRDGRIRARRAARPRLARLVAREAGKVLVEAAGDVQEAVDMAAFVAGQGRAARGARPFRPSSRTRLAWTTRQPVGVVGLITPWNFPVAIPSWKFFPALLAGNGIVLKPSEHAPACCESLRRCLRRSGRARRARPGRARPRRARARALAVHPAVGAVSFTGSVPAGRTVAAARDGGRAEARVARARRQERHDRPPRRRPRPRRRRRDVRRVRHRRAAVHLDVAARSCTRASPTSSSTGSSTERGRCVWATRSTRPPTSGPVITADAATRIIGDGRRRTERGRQRSRAAADACDRRRRLRRRHVRRARPSITGVKPDHRIATEEVFGPVLAVLEVERLDEAIDVVNSIEYGLSAAIYTSNINDALACCRPDRRRASST